jgi:hypothetical protein
VAFERASEVDRVLATTYRTPHYHLACSLALMIPVSSPDRREALAAGHANLANASTDTDLDALRD